MNNVSLIGCISSDLEVKQLPNGTEVLSFDVAYNFKRGEEWKADFFPCVAWKGTALTISKHFKKGERIAIVGRLQNRSYDDTNKVKHVITEIHIESFSFIEKKEKEVE